MLCAGQAVLHHQGALPGWDLFPLLKEAELEVLRVKLMLGGCGQVGRRTLKVCHLTGWE